MRIITALLAAILMAVMPINAQASEVTDEPKVVYPWPVTDGVTYIQMDAPDFIYGMRTAAKQVDDALEDVRIFRKGSCADRPWAYCLTVKVERHDESGYVGWFIPWGFNPRPAWGEIILNTKYDLGRRVACHEFGHAMGIEHHNRAGCVGYPTARLFSAREMAALEAHYG